MEPFNNLSANDWSSEQQKQNGEIIDVRTPGEFADSFIKGASNIDVMSPDFPNKVSTLDKSRPYFVYCRSGQRSANAMNMMKQAGFSAVYNLDGGIMGWEFNGLEVEYGGDL